MRGHEACQATRDVVEREAKHLPSGAVPQTAGKSNVAAGERETGRADKCLQRSVLEFFSRDFENSQGRAKVRRA